MSKAAELANLIGNINAGGGGVNRNVIINGAMNVAQRGTSETGVGGSNGYFTVDRWQFANVDTDGRYTVTQDSSAPAGFANSTKLDCTTADTSVASTELIKFRQKIEGQNLQGFAKGTSDAKPFAVSFYVKGNASATYNCVLGDEDNTRQCSKTFNVTTDWTRVELTFPADTTGALDDDNASSLTFRIYLHAGSNFTSGTLNSSGFASSTNANRAVGISSFFDSTDRTFFITGVQLEVGQNPTEFEHEPFERTLHKCKRYYQKLTGSYAQHSRICNGHYNGDSQFQGACVYPVQMRSTPTLALTTTSSNNSSSAYAVATAGGVDYIDNLALYQANDHATLLYTTAGGGGSSGNGGDLYVQSTITELALDAEYA